MSPVIEPMLATLADAPLNDLLGTRIMPNHVATRAGDVMHSLADVQRAMADLGYRPTTDVVAGLRECLNWWRQRSAARQVRAVLTQ